MLFPVGQLRGTDRKRVVYSAHAVFDNSNVNSIFTVNARHWRLFVFYYALFHHWPAAMKIKRQKQAKKTISFYKYNFGFREPFQILIDGTFCQAALKNKIQIKEQMPKYLMGEVQLCTTRWVYSPLSTPLLPTHYPRSLFGTTPSSYTF